jgi:CHASE3 domain sensor protein
LKLRPLSLPLFVRIAAGYGLILVVMLGIAALTLVRLHDTAGVAERLSREDVPELQLIDDLRVQILNEQIALARFEGSVDTKPRGSEDLLQPYFRAHDQIFGDLAALAQFENDASIAALAPTISLLRTQIQAVETESSREIAATRFIKTVVDGGTNAVVVHSYDEGIKALAANHAIQYVGPSGPIVFDAWHNVAGGFSVVSYDPSGETKLTGAVDAGAVAKLSASP